MTYTQAGAASGGVPIGCILLWSGSIASIPSGYALCDGTGGTPNLRDRFLVGAGTAYAVGDTGGATSVTPAGTNTAPAFTGSALGTHLHGAGTFAASAHAGAAVADHGSHTHTYTQVPNHVHGLSTVLRTATTGAATTQVTDVADTTSTADTTRKTDNPDGGVASGTTAGPGATLTHAVTQPSDHTLSGSSEAVSAGTPAGTVAAPVFTGSSQENRPLYYALAYIQRIS